VTIVVVGDGEKKKKGLGIGVNTWLLRTTKGMDGFFLDAFVTGND
jgi:hypothetical protein